MIRADQANLPPLIREHYGELAALCGECHVRRLWVFGSVLRDDFDPGGSDLDFAMKFRDDAPAGGLRGPYFNLLLGLEDLFGRSVDLVERHVVRNPYFRAELDQTCVPVYEA